MPLFLIERNFVDQLNLTPENVRQIEDVNDEIGVQWLFSFLSADHLKTYCLYEAAEPEALLEQARVIGMPADTIVEVARVEPAMN